MDSVFKQVLVFFVSLLRVVTTITRPLSEWILDIIYWIILGRTKRLPPISNQILLMSAKELASKIRNQQLRADEVMAAYIERCRSIHPIINAQVEERFDEAMAEAISVDILINQMLNSGRKTKSQIAKDTPLLGVPFTCKESIGVKGMARTNGCVRNKDNKSLQDSDAAAIYRKSGAIPIAVTNVPEESLWWETASLVFGWTKNPFDKRRSVGGSSGGESAIITACGSVIGIGSDLAGSIRIPASFCGIYAHKPTRGLISNARDTLLNAPVNLLLTTGPMCRYVEDLPMLTFLLAGDNSHKVNWQSKVDFRRVQVFYMEEFPCYLLSATNNIKAAIRRAVKHFEDEYHITAVKLDIPELKYGFSIWECKLLETGPPSFKEMLAPPDGKICITWEFIKSLFRRSNHTWPALYFAAVDRRTKDKFYYKCLDMYNELERKLEGYLQGDAILLVPTHPDPPPHYLMTIPKYPNIAYTCIFNALGYPSTQIPTGLSRGLPIGIQAIGSQFKDSLTLAAAVELDKVFKGWINPSLVTA